MRLVFQTVLLLQPQCPEGGRDPPLVGWQPPLCMWAMLERETLAPGRRAYGTHKSSFQKLTSQKQFGGLQVGSVLQLSCFKPCTSWG